MSVFISTPNVLLAEVRVLVRNNKVVAAIKVDAAINLVAAIKVVGIKAEGLHVSRLAQYWLRASNASDWWGAKFNASDYSNYEIL